LSPEDEIIWVLEAGCNVPIVVEKTKIVVEIIK
jgi:hypothetical protein